MDYVLHCISYFTAGFIMDACYGEWTKSVTANEQFHAMVWAWLIGFVQIFITIGLIESKSWVLGGFYILGLGIGTGFVVWRHKQKEIKKIQNEL